MGSSNCFIDERAFRIEERAGKIWQGREAGILDVTAFTRSQPSFGPCQSMNGIISGRVAPPCSTKEAEAVKPVRPLFPSSIRDVGIAKNHLVHLVVFCTSKVFSFSIVLADLTPQNFILSMK